MNVFIYLSFPERKQTCQHCQKSFQYPRALAVHNTFGCEELGSRTSSNDTLDCNLIDKASNDDLSTTYAGRRSTEMREVEHHDREIGPKQTSRQQQSLRSTGDTAPKLNPQFSVTLGHSRVLSNPRLARLISSFPRPHFHKFAHREPQSLAEYHKQEFRKKFQGNEHYLRRHLYRENMERKGSVKNRRPLAEDEEREMSMEGVDKELHIKQEEEEFIRCFSDDYSSGHTSPTDESFMRGRTADEPRCNFQGEDLPLNDSLNINVPENAVTNGYFTVTTHETQHMKRSSRAAQECTCRDRDISNSIPKQRKRFTRYEEINASNETETEGSKESTSNASTLKQLSAFETQANLTRLGSYHVLQRTQTDHVSFGQHLPCHYCYSTRSMAYAPNKNVIRRYHEPAFLVDPMYRYTAYPRMLSYFAQQSTNSTQVAPRNQGFTCEYCGKVYCRKYVLKIHKRTHTGFKPLRCKVCDKSFSDPSNMKKHVKLHENEDTVHKCRYCGRNFVRYRGLLNHIKSKHSEQIPISNAM